MTDSPDKPALSPVKRALVALEEMQAKLRAAEQRMREPLAIVGMGCRFPGGVSDPESCWELLRAGRDAVTEVPPDRWDVDAYYDPDPAKPGKMSTRWGGFLERVDEFDPEVFGISPREAQTMDPQQRLLLEVVWEALERAGQDPGSLAGTRTGVFVGIAGSDYAQILARNVDPARIDAYFASGVAHSIASGRLSYALGLIGPSLSIDTACSSSLVAVHQACQSLRSRESDMAIAAGVNLVLLPDHAITFSKSQMMAADGRCKAFDARADGFVRAEGCGVIVIKRLADALANGDPMLAVIRGTAVNQDGASSGLTAPNGVSQQALLREALANAGLRPDEIGYVEAHGTGTSLGDPIEVRALGAVFGPGRSAASPLFIGSVKTNFGHTEATAGLAGLIKAVLCLQRREIAPSLHFQAPNPHIAWEDLPIVVPTAVQPFPIHGARRAAGVSSFGFSGTNAHVVLEETPVSAATASEAAREAELLVLSAKNEAALIELARRYAGHVRAHPELTLGEVCHTARVGRNHFAYRLAVFAKDRTELLDQLGRVSAGQSSNTIMRGVVSGTARVKVAFRYPAAMGAAAREAAAARWRAWGVEPVDAGNDVTLDIDTEPTWRQTLLALARLYVSGVHLDWRGFDRERRDPVVLLPTYPFQRQRYWVEQAPPASSDESILGPRVDSPALDGALFTSRLGAGGAGAFALEHLVFGVPILPATGYLAMAREAASQVLASPGVRLTSCEFHEALPLSDTSTLDVQLIVRRGANGAQIQIFSRATEVSEWTLHATTEASVDTHASDGSSPPDATRNSQRVDRETFYTDLSRRGLEFGALFRGVETLAQAQGEAMGEVTLPAALHSEARHYAIHPVLLDAALQVVGAAVVSGAPTDAVFMPFEIESCQITSMSRSITKCRAHARMRSQDTSAEVLSADLDVYDTFGKHVATLSGIRFKRATRAALARLRERAVNRYLIELTWDLEDDRVVRVDLQAIAASVRSNVAANSVATGWERWNEVEPRLDRVCRAYIARAFADLGMRWNAGDRIESASLARQLRVKPEFVRLLGRFLAILARDGVVRREGDVWRVVHAPSNVDVNPELASLRRDHPEFQAEIAFTERCGPELAAALTGASEPLQLLFPGGNSATAEHLYRDSPSAQLYNGIVRDSIAAIVAQWPAKRPLRVLEIGGGTAATTSHVTAVLSPSGTQYTFTDLSPLFVAKAKERFASTGFFNARTLDIEQDPRKQGLTSEFDLIIAANVLHATRDLAETFAHVRQLLAPGGTLVCVEITRPQDWIDLSFGLTDGWWRFTDMQLRPEYPLLTAREWAGFLADNGFEDVAMVPEPEGASRALSLNAVMLARPAAAVDVPKRHLVLADRGAVSLATVERLRSAGQAVCVAFAGESYARGGDGAITLDPLSREQFERLLGDAAVALGGWPERVVHLWSLDRLVPRDAVADLLGGALHLTQVLISQTRAPAPSLSIFTRGGVALGGQPVDPLAAALWGWARSLRLEHPELRCISVDLDPGDVPGTPATIVETLTRSDEEVEIAWRERAARVSRLRHPRTAPPPATDTPRRLAITQPGDLDNLVLTGISLPEPAAGEVAIRVRATGLNFRDVLSALGTYPGDSGPLGSELAGRVTAVGQGVTNVRVGDDVVAVAAGAFATHVIANATLVVPKPHALTYVQAASLPNAFMTAHWALNHLGKMKSGERVLIHAAAGGVGLAAVQLAMRAGAEIFATAGSDEKRTYLRSIGIRHVFDSRSLAFSREVLAVTSERGVDLVLNSLAGEFIPASLATLAPNGRFLEIGRTGVWSAEQVRARHPGVTYHLIDLGRDYVATPDKIRPMLLELIEATSSGALQPLPIRAFSLAGAAAAFRFMAQGRHVGKIVITQPWQPSAGGIAARADGSYWITGGLTGLGLAVAEWLVGRGARHVALMGRRAPDAIATAAIARMREQGAKLLTIQGDVSIEADIARAVESMRAAGLPALAGIVHAAGALDDGAIESQTLARYEQVFAAKIRGAQLLHAATRETSLDFFMLFSSAAGLFGSAGQTSHGAANAWLDGFAYSLREAGVPGISINWGAWSGIGAAASAAMAQRLHEKGLERLTPEEGLAALGAVLRRAPAQLAVVAADWPKFVEQLPAGLRRYMGALAESVVARITPATPAAATASQATEAESLAARLAAAPADRRRALLRSEIRVHACKVLSLSPTHPIDVRSPLAGLGLDSLMAVELRNRLGTATGHPLPATLLFDHPTIDALCDFLSQLLSIAPVVTPVPPETVTSAAEDLVGRVASLSEEELDRLLAARMAAE